MEYYYNLIDYDLRVAEFFEASWNKNSSMMFETRFLISQNLLIRLI